MRNEKNEMTQVKINKCKKCINAQGVALGRQGREVNGQQLDEVHLVYRHMSFSEHAGPAKLGSEAILGLESATNA